MISGKDTVVAAHLLVSGYKATCVAGAQVYLSAHFSWAQEFRRSFEIGMFHSRES